MVNIDTVYQRVLSIANKEQRGYITPQEFNLIANQAQQDIFEQYFYDLDQFKRKQNAPAVQFKSDETSFSEMIELIQNKLKPFTTLEAVVTGFTFPTVNMNGNPVYRTGNALRNMSPARIALYIKRMHQAGQYTRNDARNITARTAKVNIGRNTEFNALDRAILNAGKQLKIFGGTKNGGNGGNGGNGSNGGNGGNGGLKIGAGSSNSFNGNLTKPSLADEAFKHLQLDNYHKIKTPFGVMPRA